MPPKANKPAAPKKPTKPSAKSKTGNTACSQAASNWQLSIRGKEPLDPQTYATLAKCRAMTRTAKQADDRARMGYNLNEQGAAALKGRLQKRFDQSLITQKSRDERLKMLLQQRKAKQAAVAAKPADKAADLVKKVRELPKYTLAKSRAKANQKKISDLMSNPQDFLVQRGKYRSENATYANRSATERFRGKNAVADAISDLKERRRERAEGDLTLGQRRAMQKPADKAMTGENKIPESKQVQAMKNKLERMKGQFDNKFENWSSQRRGHGGTPFIMDNSKGQAQYKRHQKGNESLINLNKAIKEQEEKIQAAEYRHIGRHTQTKKSEKFVERNPVSPGLQYLEQKGLVKSWPKKPEFHFVQGMDKTALITVDGRVGVARKYNGGTDEKFLAAKKLASIANSYNRTQSLVLSVRQKPGYGVARASAAGNRELVGLKMRDKGQVTTQPAKPAFSRQGQPASKLPPRTADTMSEAIALSSPNGRMSKRTKDAATKRLSTALFGPNGLQGPQVKQPTEIERLRRDAANLRDLASRGLKPRAHAKLADQFEARAIELEKASAAPKFSRQGQLAPGRGTKERSEIAKQKWEDRPRRFLMGQTYLTKSGEPMLIHSKRQGYLTAFPYENGKPVVHSGSAIKFAYTDMAKKIAPDFRTDITNTPANLKETNNTTKSPKPFSRGGQLAPGRGTEERKKAAGILQNLRSRNNDGRALARTIRNDAVFTRRWNDKKHLISSDAGFKSRRILEQSYQQRVNAEAGYTDAQHAANKLVTKTGKVKESAIREANIEYGSNVGLKQNAIARKLGSLRDSASRHLNNYRMLKQSGVSETSYIAKPKPTKEFLKNPLSRLRNAITTGKQPIPEVPQWAKDYRSPKTATPKPQPAPKQQSYNPETAVEKTRSGWWAKASDGTYFPTPFKTRKEALSRTRLHSEVISAKYK